MLSTTLTPLLKMDSKHPTTSFDLRHAIEILEATPTVLTSLLSGLSEEWIYAKENEDSWSPFDIVGHLILGDRTDWIPRTKMILEKGDANIFKPFDRFAHLHAFEGKTIDELLVEFSAIRRDNVATLKSLGLTEENLNKIGTHPALGTVTLRQLLATWTVHDLGHIRQIVRAMAKRYKKETGPWQAYLPVLHE